MSTPAQKVLANAVDKVRALYSEIGDIAGDMSPDDEDIVRMLKIVRSIECDVTELAGYVGGGAEGNA
jgi:hypothetical protein